MSGIGTREAAAMLGISEGRVRQYYLAGRLPGRKIGNSLVFEETDVAALKAAMQPRGWPKGRPRKPREEKP